MSGQFVPICAIAGSIAGCVSGAMYSVKYATLGTLIGLPLGVGVYFAAVVPYVFWIVRHEQRQTTNKDALSYEPPLFWKMLFLPLMIVSIIASIVLTWFSTRALAQYFG